MLGLVAMVLSAGALFGLPSRPASADETATLRLDPANRTVDGGETFTMDIVQNAGVPTTGAQSNVVFDRSLVELLDMRPGTVYASGIFLFGVADDGSNARPGAAIAAANATGTLQNAATLLLPGTGSVPAGDAVFLTLTFKARQGPGGDTSIGLRRLSMLDETGAALKVAATDAAVTVRPSAVTSQSPGPTASPTTSSSAVPRTPAPGATGGPAVVSADPPSVQIEAGASVIIQLRVATEVPVSAVILDFAFDPKVIQITGVARGEAWSRATVLGGGTGQALADAIAQANLSGVLLQTGVYLLPVSGTYPSGSSTFLTVTVRGLVSGTSSLALANAKVLDAQGAEVPVSGTAALPSTRTGSGPDPSIIALIAVVIAIVVGIVRLIRSGVLPERWLRRWPYIVSMLLGLVPVAIFAGLLAMLVVNAWPAMTRSPGIQGLFADRYSGSLSLGGPQGEWGLLPAIVGTVEVTLIAIIIALPASLAIAIIIAEFPLGPLGRLLRPLMGILSGIPPIVYAIAGAAFVTTFIAPKFAGSADVSSFDPTRLGVAAADWPPRDVPWNVTAFPWPPNAGGLPSSTLLGGILIALLVIPFMTPLILDAMQSVPRMAREASFALGANRGYTVRRVILPQAMSGIVTAVALATLKAMGDVLIVAFAVGWQAEVVPDPIFDIFERTSSLAAEGANLLGNLETAGLTGCNPRSPACGVGYFSGLLLLLVAAVVVVATTYLERRWRRRLHA